MNREGTRPWPVIALYVIPAFAGMTWERGVDVDSRYLLSQAQATGE
ncbi:MAG: hypothetical protein WBC61_02200 [Dehalococcoidia bacterium]